MRYSDAKPSSTPIHANAAVVHEDRERERNPREEEIPDQIAKVDVPGMHVTHEDERDAEERCDEQAQDGPESAAAGAHRQPASASSSLRSRGFEIIAMLPSGARGHSSG